MKCDALCVTLNHDGLCDVRPEHIIPSERDIDQIVRMSGYRRAGRSRIVKTARGYIAAITHGGRDIIDTLYRIMTDPIAPHREQRQAAYALGNYLGLHVVEHKGKLQVEGQVSHAHAHVEVPPDIARQVLSRLSTDTLRRIESELGEDADVVDVMPEDETAPIKP